MQTTTHLTNIDMKYTTNETLTGVEWIDGKSIYRKVIPFTVPDFSSSPAEVNIVHNLSIEVYLRADITSIIPFPGDDTVHNFSLGDLAAKASSGESGELSIYNEGFTSTERDQVKLESAKSSTTYTTDFYLILEYTKL